MRWLLRLSRRGIWPFQLLWLLLLNWLWVLVRLRRMLFWRRVLLLLLLRNVRLLRRQLGFCIWSSGF